MCNIMKKFLVLLTISIGIMHTPEIHTMNPAPPAENAANQEYRLNPIIAINLFGGIGTFVVIEILKTYYYPDLNKTTAHVIAGVTQMSGVLGYGISLLINNCLKKHCNAPNNDHQPDHAAD